MDKWEIGANKESFVLNFNGGEIWCEHLDSLGKYTNVLMDKLTKDIEIIRKPSSPASIIINLDESEIDKSLLNFIFRKLNNCDKVIRKIALVGLPRKLTNEVPAMSITMNYPVKCFSDFEKAKEWVL